MREVERDKKLRRREYIFIYKIPDTPLSYKVSNRASPVSAWLNGRTSVLVLLFLMLAVAAVLSAPPVGAAPPVIEVESESVALGETNAVTVGIGKLDVGEVWEAMVRRASGDGLAVLCQTAEFAVEQEVMAGPSSVTLRTSPDCPAGEYYFRVRYTETISGLSTWMTVQSETWAVSPATLRSH